ncbi:MAG TPA: 3-hydroxyacyl-CoA dehydrogenase/enoyl-CoA hydratase family protein [Bryobacteraceae bacterium]|nr:3-hydroxyacyl-CoA dehydrogenase/enoyl-CoA hydratase family protein [Bryobacteraceae bacterium]
MTPLRRVAVLGAGTMGSRIAAHFANAGIPAFLLDIVLPSQPNRNAAALGGLDATLKQKPAAFFTPETKSLITPGNFEDDLAKVRDCDWIVEAVTENLEIKRALIEKVLKHRKPGTIFSTNTSGIPLASIAEGFPTEFREHFLGTHFFNPPRYLHLLEMIPGPATLPAVYERVAEFSGRHLGKGVVPCKDTPNFIANRIGSFLGGTVQHLTVEMGLTIEEVDALTGPLIGLPKSASYRLLDLVGLDVWAHVTKNLYDLVPGDPSRERFVLPPFFAQMIERGWLGDKRGQGFYKRTGKGDKKEILALDLNTLEYQPSKKVRFASVDSVRNIEDLPQRLRALMGLTDRAGTFLWRLFSDLVLYSAAMVPEISDRVVEIDRAMRWGYANSLGPFELWDALGVEETVARMRQEQRPIPENVENMLCSGAKSFYQAPDHDRRPHHEYFDLQVNSYKWLEDRPGIIVLKDVKHAHGVVKKNGGASLIDIGNGVLCLEFHSKMNSLGDDQISLIRAGIDETSKNFEAMIIANQGENFSVGANLMLVLLAAQEEEWEELEAAINRFQQATLMIKYAPKPVVSAPFGLTLGGGCEIALHSARVQASAETYIGLVEVGVGVIPGAGGTKEMLLRFGNAQKAFELIAYAKVATSAAEARAFGLLRPQDQISMNPERLIDDAKALALSIVPAYVGGVPRTDVEVGGAEDLALLKTGIYLARQADYISDYDTLVGEKLAYVLSGGPLTGRQTVTEQYLLDLEREAFLSLCGQRKTQERMQHMLKTGKPLRN